MVSIEKNGLNSHTKLERMIQVCKEKKSMVYKRENSNIFDIEGIIQTYIKFQYLYVWNVSS